MNEIWRGFRFVFTQILDRMLGEPIKPEDAYPDEGTAPPVKANITYYGDQGVRPHRSKKRAR